MAVSIVELKIWSHATNNNHNNNIVLPQSGPEPWFKLDFWSGSPWSGPWFLQKPEPDQKMVLGSRSSWTIPIWFGLPKPFRTLIDFDFDNVSLNVKLLSSGFALLVNQATFSPVEDSYDLPVAFHFQIYLKRGPDNKIVSCLLEISEDSCALNTDGFLKDASDIIFYNDPDDSVPLPQVPSSTQPTAKDAFSVLLQAGHIPALVMAGSQCSTHTSKPSACIRDADNACAQPSSSSTASRKHALSSATNPLVPKKAVMWFLSPLDSDEDVPSSPPNPAPEESSCDELISQLDNEDHDDEIKSGNEDATQMLSKHEYTVDVHTIFTHTSDGWARLLVNQSQSIPFVVYHQHCEAVGIMMHPHMIPPGEDLAMTQTTLDASLISKPLVFTKEGLLEYVMELIVTEDKDADVDNLTKQLAALEHDPEAIVEDGFDVGEAVGKALALIEQICKSPQAQAFFRKSCEEEGIAVHDILTWVKMCWASLFKCLERFLSLHLAVNHFTLLADESHKVPTLHNKSYSDFRLDRADLRKIRLMHDVLKELVTVQQSFSSVVCPTAWQTIPTLECLTNTWQTMVGNLEYGLIADAIRKGLKNVEKYYQKAGDLDVYFICLVLDPNYKLTYVKSRWSETRVSLT
ncbi:hypothetical protein BDR06DRAFT_1002531 [Suillus hirtellus]|nr:hypothetical protein BDR06DRAFT_1002531 [Suillus hirtellus]